MYYLRQRTRVSGPFTTDQVRAMLHRGRIARSDKISTDRKMWQSIAETPELIDRPQPVEPAPAEPAATVPAADPRRWYYTLGGAQQQAAIDTATLAQLVSSGQVGPGEMAWTEGFADWQMVGTIPEFAAATAPGFPIGNGFPLSPDLPPSQADELLDLPFNPRPVARKRGRR